MTTISPDTTAAATSVRPGDRCAGPPGRRFRPDLAPEDWGGLPGGTMWEDFRQEASIFQQFRTGRVAHAPESRGPVLHVSPLFVARHRMLHSHRGPSGRATPDGPSRLPRPRQC